MPLPWKKRKNIGVSRLSRVLSDFQAPKTRNSFVLETGFPTSVVDLFVKNRNRLKKQAKKKKEPKEISEVYGERIETDDDNRKDNFTKMKEGGIPEVLSSDRTLNVKNPGHLKNRCASARENRNSDRSSELSANRCEFDEENGRIDKHTVFESSNKTSFSGDVPVPVDNNASNLESLHHRCKSPSESPRCKQLGIEEFSIADRQPTTNSGDSGNKSVFHAAKIMDNFHELLISVMFVLMMLAFTTKKLAIGTISAFLLILLKFPWRRLGRTVGFVCSAQIMTLLLHMNTSFFSKTELVLNQEDDESNVTASRDFGCANTKARIIGEKEGSRSKRIRSKMIQKLMPKKLRDRIKEKWIQERETYFDRTEEQHETYDDDRDDHEENVRLIEKRVEINSKNCSMFVMVVLAGLIGGRVLALALTVFSALISPFIVRHWR